METTAGRLDGKVALVTGGSRGLGKAIALELARNGARVAVNYVSHEPAARAVGEEIAALRGVEVAQENVLLVRADVSRSDEARAMVANVLERWGELHILVNNAGISADRPLREMTDEHWHAVINLNLNGVFYCMSEALPAMAKQRYGRIINITSIVGQLATREKANYAAAKAGIMGLTRSAALEYARFNVTVNAVSPGITLTDMYDVVPQDILDRLKKHIPMGRFGKPEEIARAVLFFAVDGDFITGQQLAVNGGHYM